MPKFRKKPVVIEAIQFYPSMPFYQIAVDFAGKPELFEMQGEIMLIKTLEGTMMAKAGDWIIKGVKGEFYPCKPDIFQLTYDAYDVIMPEVESSTVLTNDEINIFKEYDIDITLYHPKPNAPIPVDINGKSLNGHSEMLKNIS